MKAQGVSEISGSRRLITEEKEKNDGPWSWKCRGSNTTEGAGPKGTWTEGSMLERRWVARPRELDLNSGSTTSQPCDPG